MKALYLDDSVTTCDCCGRTGLKATVAMLKDCGGIVHYGRTCASRNSGKDSKQIRKEMHEEEARKQNLQRFMAANAKALESWENEDLGCPALQVQRRNYHQTGGFPVHGKFGDWLRNRSLGL